MAVPASVPICVHSAMKTMCHGCVHTLMPATVSMGGGRRDERVFIVANADQNWACNKTWEVGPTHRHFELDPHPHPLLIVNQERIKTPSRLERGTDWHQKRQRIRNQSPSCHPPHLSSSFNLNSIHIRVSLSLKESRPQATLNVAPTGIPIRSGHSQAWQVSFT